MFGLQTFLSLFQQTFQRNFFSDPLYSLYNSAVMLCYKRLFNCSISHKESFVNSARKWNIRIEINKPTTFKYLRFYYTFSSSLNQLFCQLKIFFLIHLQMFLSNDFLFVSFFIFTILFKKNENNLTGTSLTVCFFFKLKEKN